MKSRSYIKNLAVALVLLMVTKVLFAAFSFTGITDENNKNNKYSLKNLSSYSHKAFSLSHLRTTLQYRGSLVINQKSNTTGVELNSVLEYDRGNTAYVLPYKLKVKVPKFKTPSPDNR
ncbi:MAG: hypothetical protein JST94_11385 [Bacteroidetes bacterium]|nr:hypothetical protein [Bacteroidota bacterium]MBS1672028.1 hypothetical protein [Bacteroidota bacterium]